MVCYVDLHENDTGIIRISAGAKISTTGTSVVKFDQTYLPSSDLHASFNNITLLVLSFKKRKQKKKIII